MSIWFRDYQLKDVLSSHKEADLIHALGIEFIELGPDFIRGRMPVDARTRQPYGILHGGASVALAETLGSFGASLTVDPAKQYAVGLEVNANHLRAKKAGHVIGTARPLHRGRSTQVWEIKIRDETQRLVCVARLTLAILDGAVI
jgi:1,4-dihydroxy-2-naphthoyl-CoA hydrolase